MKDQCRVPKSAKCPRSVADCRPNSLRDSGNYQLSVPVIHETRSTDTFFQCAPLSWLPYHTNGGLQTGQTHQTARLSNQVQRLFEESISALVSHQNMKFPEE